MGADPVRQGLGPGRLGIGEAGGAEHGDEQFGLAGLAAARIDDGDLPAGIVHEDLVAGNVLLAHGRRQTMSEAAVEFAEAAVAVAARMSRAVLLP